MGGYRVKYKTLYIHARFNIFTLNGPGEQDEWAFVFDVLKQIKRSKLNTCSKVNVVVG